MEICDSSKGLLVSLGAHLIFFLLVGAAGYQAYQKQQAQDPIYTVEIVSGSPYHGYGDVPGAHLGNGNPPAPAAAQQQAAPQESASAPVMQPAPQDVIPDGQVAEDRPMAAASSVSSAAAGAAARPGTAAQGDPEGGSPDGVPNGGNPAGSPGEPPGPAGGDGPGFDTEAVQSDVSASFLGGTGSGISFSPAESRHPGLRPGPDDRRQGRHRGKCFGDFWIRLWPDGSGGSGCGLWISVRTSV